MPENATAPQRLRSGPGKGLRLVGPCTARGRLRVILPLLRFRARKALGEDPRVLLPSGAELLTFAELLRYRARHSHVSQRQLFRWLVRFEHGGYAALADRPRKDKGVSRMFSKRRTVVAFIAMRCFDNWGAVRIYRALLDAWQRLCRDDSRPPCFDTVRVFLRSLIPARALARRHSNG